MKTIVIKNETMQYIVKRVMVCFKDTIQILVTGKKTADGSMILQISACNDMTIGNLQVAVETDIEEPYVFVVGADFLGAVKSMFPLNKDFEMELQETFINIRCDMAKIQVSFSTEEQKYSMPDVQNESFVKYIVGGDALKKAVRRAGFWLKQDGKEDNCLDGLCISPVDGVFKLYGVAENNIGIAYSSVPYTICSEEEGDFFTLPNATFMKAVEGFEMNTEKDVVLVVFERQVMVKNGNEVFTFSKKTGNYPVDAFQRMIESEEKEYSFTLSAADLKMATSIVTSNKVGDFNKKSVYLKIVQDKLLVTSDDGANSMSLDIEDSLGSEEIRLKVQLLSVAVSNTFGEKVIIWGTNCKSPVRVCGSDEQPENVQTIILPISKGPAATD